MSQTIPLAVLASIDPVRRDAVALDVVLDRPRTAVVGYDVVVEEGELRRFVMDGGGVHEDRQVPMESSCVSCAVREDAIATLRRVLDDSSWDAVVLALPVGMDPAPIARPLGVHTRPGADLHDARLAAVAVAVDLEHLADDLLGDDALDERNLELGDDDRRSVGEALAAQLGYADVVLVTGDPRDHPVASDLLDHVRAVDGQRLDSGTAHTTAQVLAGAHDPVHAERRADPRVVPSLRRRSSHGVWTTTLHTTRPFHPDRLVANVEPLGGGRVRTRGVFWVPTRPDSLCSWDGAGGQVSIGDLGPWGLDAPHTRFVVTGTGDEERRIRDAFTDSLLTHRELTGGLAPWLGRADPLEPWLGLRS